MTSFPKLLSTRFHNLFLVKTQENLELNDLPQFNLGLDLFGYIRFANLLDKKTGKLFIPSGIKQIKIDIGLSFAAPNSALWLENLKNRIVFGFEPNPDCVKEIITGKNKKRGPIYHYLNPKHINKDFFIFNIALDNTQPMFKKFYMTSNDPGTSSLYKPKRFKIKKEIVVPCLPLHSFLSLVPWDRFKYIEHIKLDTQGNDLKILQSAGPFLKQIVFVTAEVTAGGYSYTHTAKELDNFMKHHKFNFISGTDKGGNKTYVNSRFVKIADQLDYSTENK